MIVKSAHKLIICILVCAIVNAFLLVTFSDYFTIKQLGVSTVVTYLKGLILAFTYIVVFCFWIGYSLFYFLFDLLARRRKIASYTFYVGLGAVLGGIESTLFLAYSHNLKSTVFYCFPTNTEAITIPTYIVVGGVYGLVYRKWLFHQADIEYQSTSD
jgi:hypothetical protein